VRGRSRIVATVLGAAVACASGPPAASGGVADPIGAVIPAQEASGAEVAPSLRHQLRHHRAVAELVAALPDHRRPDDILYLASGSHLGVLAACSGLPAGAPCRLVLTEVDATVQEDLTHGLEALAAGGAVAEVASGAPLGGAGGRREWRFALGGRPVSLTLDVVPARDDPPLVRPELLEDADLVVSHDWSGDPIGNLQVIRELLAAADAVGLERPPMLMIEDLEAHPYPVDLALLGPLARTSAPYGHRGSDAGLGRHGTVELGTPLFGGGVVLGFDHGWWRGIGDGRRTAVLDLLLLSAFDDRRRNVLEGGDDPLLAPALLDWWTGFGDRTLAGADLRRTPLARLAAVDGALAVLPRLDADVRWRLACRLRLYRCLLEARAAGFELAELTPDASLERRMSPDEFPSDEMRGLYREALRHLGRMREERGAVVETTAPVLERLRSEDVVRATASCPCSLPSDPGPDAWAAAYREHLDRLRR